MRAVALALAVAALAGAAGATPAAAAPAPSLARIVIPAVGPGYSVVSAGPLSTGQVAQGAPDPSAAADALHHLAGTGTITTYQRVWEDAAQGNEVQDLVVRFSSAAGARLFATSVQRSLKEGEVLSAGPLAAIPGAFQATYFGTTSNAGVGQAIALRVGTSVVVLSFFSSQATSDPQPITSADAVVVARAQQTALRRAAAGRGTGG